MFLVRFLYDPPTQKVVNLTLWYVQNIAQNRSAVSIAEKDRGAGAKLTPKHYIYLNWETCSHYFLPRGELVLELLKLISKYALNLPQKSYRKDK